MSDADKRIKALLDRAGCPMMVVKNTEQKNFEDVRRSILRVADEQYDGSLIEYIRDLANTIDRMEGALENVIIERDAAISDLNKAEDCESCAHDKPIGACMCSCARCDEECQCKLCLEGKRGYEWRGVPDKEESSD